MPDRDVRTPRQSAGTPGETTAEEPATLPEPRPELLARVLDGLRELPSGPAGPARGTEPDPEATSEAASGALPLPRRRP